MVPNAGGTAVVFDAFVPVGMMAFFVSCFVTGSLMQQRVATQPTRFDPATTSPSLPELESWLGTLEEPPRLVPIYREVLADTDTPVSAFVKLRNDSPAFMLESVEGGERLARYSFIGRNPLATIQFRNGSVQINQGGAKTTASYGDPTAVLREELERYRSARPPGLTLPRFVGGAVGYLSYESIRAFEPRIGAAAGAGLGLPDGTFLIVDSLLVFDNMERTVKAVAHVDVQDPRGLAASYVDALARVDEMIAALQGPLPALPGGSGPMVESIDARAESNTSHERYFEIVERAKEYIREGDIFQVVLSQRIDISTPAHPFSLYRALRAINPSPYMFFLDFQDHQIVGASPELLVRLEDGVVTNHPIAGTRKRGADPAEDADLAEDLLADEKERAEHVMLVDLGRNDVGRVAAPGSVRVPRFMGIDRYSHVMHIVSHVEGDLRPELDAFDALRACFPAGTVSGAPKVRAMEIIAELETDQRGPYAGAVGYIDFSGGMDTCIALRTLVIKDGVASLQAGGGIVADSTPAGEYAESFQKMGALRRAIELAEQLETEMHPGEPS